MLSTLARRDLLLAGVSVLGLACTSRSASAPTSALSNLEQELQAIERRVGGRLGVFALDTDSGRRFASRPDERFAMCSTFKWLLAAAILERSDRGDIALDEQLPYGYSDLLTYAPVARANLSRGSLPVGELAEAVVTVSDNTAANLLLSRLGGPAALTRFVRSVGDTETRLDRFEPDLNENRPDDHRDTTTPRAMVGTLQAVLLGDALSPAARGRLIGWLRNCKTGSERLRRGLPAGWTAGDKTGTGERGAASDVAIIWPPARPPVLVAAYLSDSRSPVEALSAALADVGRHVARLVA